MYINHECGPQSAVHHVIGVIAEASAACCSDYQIAMQAK